MAQSSELEPKSTQGVTEASIDLKESSSPRPKEEDAKEQDVIEVEKKDDEPVGAVTIQEEVQADPSKKKKKNKKGKKKDASPPKEVENPYEQV